VIDRLGYVEGNAVDFCFSCFNTDINNRIKETKSSNYENKDEWVTAAKTVKCQIKRKDEPAQSNCYSILSNKGIEEYNDKEFETVMIVSGMSLDKVEVEHDSVVNGIELVSESITYVLKDMILMEENHNWSDHPKVVQANSQDNVNIGTFYNDKHCWSYVARITQLYQNMNQFIVAIPEVTSKINKMQLLMEKSEKMSFVRRRKMSFETMSFSFRKLTSSIESRWCKLA